MDFTFTEEQERFREEVREFCRQEVTPELLRELEESKEEHHPGFYRKMVERGYVGMHWPREYGGQGKTHMEMAIFFEEMGYARAPLGRYTGSVIFVGESIITYGNEFQKKAFIPKIASGEITCCWCLTEPNSGSDAAALQTRAELKGDHFVVNGQKVFTSGAHLADLGMVAVRTGGSVPKHRGISVLLVDMKSPGIEIRPLWTVGGWRVNHIFFDNVVVPKERLMGEMDNGWRHITVTLSFERSGIARVGDLLRTYDDLAAHVRESQRPVSEGLLHQLAEIRADVEAARWLNYRIAWMQDRGLPPVAEASMGKLLCSELHLRLGSLGMDILGYEGQIKGEDAPVGGQIEKMFRSTPFHLVGGGTSEILKTVMAIRGLGLPRE